MPAQLTQTSPIAAAIDFQGILLQMAVAGSPLTYQTIANVGESWSMPITAEEVEITNAGDAWKRKITTLKDMGKITFTIYWAMQDQTHKNVQTLSPTLAGLRYLLINNVLTDFAFVYPDGDLSTDYFPAYVSGFQVKGKIGGVFTAEITLTNAGPPTLV
jgi:Lambda phage tail tube protein, TTP